MLRVLSLNLNGIRSAASKGVFDWLAGHDADIVCVQELKAQLPDLTTALMRPDGYTGYFHCAEKKGYSGVGIYSRREPDRVIEGFGNAEFDAEGPFGLAQCGQHGVLIGESRLPLGRLASADLGAHAATVEQSPGDEGQDGCPGAGGFKPVARVEGLEPRALVGEGGEGDRTPLLAV